MTPKRKQPPLQPFTDVSSLIHANFITCVPIMWEITSNFINTSSSGWLNDNKDDKSGLKAAVTYLGEDNETPYHEICIRDPPLDVIVAYITHAQKKLRIKDRYGSLPIRHACTYGYSLDIIKALVTGYPESLAHEGPIGDDLPLNYAIYNGASAEVLSFLMESYPAGIDQKDNAGRTSLDFFKRKGICHKDRCRWNVPSSSCL